MRIAVDGRVLHGPPTGTGIYARGLINSLADSPCVRRVAVATYTKDPRGPAPVDELMAGGVGVRELGLVRSRLPGFASRTGLPIPFDLIMPGADWHLYPNFRWLPVRRGGTITVVHDLAVHHHPWSVPEPYRRRVASYTEEALRRSTVIVTPSHAVADEVRQRWSSKAIVAVRPGADRRRQDDRASAPAGAGTRRGVLFVGTIQPRKNVGTLLSAYANLPEAVRQDHPLTVVGQRGWEDSAVFEDLARMEPQVTVTGYVSPPTLREAYETAAVVVAPSWYEGFDLPVLEAMATGVPVVCSDIAVHREVAGTASRYFSPDAPGELTRQLESLLGDEDLWHDAAVRGSRRSRQFTWTDAVEDLCSQLVRHG